VLGIVEERHNLSGRRGKNQGRRRVGGVGNTVGPDEMKKLKGAVRFGTGSKEI